MQYRPLPVGVSAEEYFCSTGVTASAVKRPPWRMRSAYLFDRRWCVYSECRKATAVGRMRSAYLFDRHGCYGECRKATAVGRMRSADLSVSNSGG